MAWWGKLVGGAFGFLLGGPLGAALGAAVGHSFDRGLAIDHGEQATTRQERIQTAFFTATFAVLGHIAKADGQVSRDEIALADALMEQMALNADQRKVARALFRQGKAPDFDLDGVLRQFVQECHRRQTLLQMFIEIQVQGAYADGTLHAGETAALHKIADALGFSRAQFLQIEALVRAQRDAGGQRGARKTLPLDAAYRVLGVDPKATDAEVKKAYRRLMSQHHPDKLVAKGLPDEMMKVATARAQEIKAAYDAVKASRGGLR